MRVWQKVRRYRFAGVVASSAVVLFAGCDAIASIRPSSSSDASGFESLIPTPRFAARSEGVEDFHLSGATEIHVASAQFLPAADLLAERLRPATGFALPVRISDDPPPGSVYLTSVGTDDMESEEYRLSIEADRVTLRAGTPTGAVWGIQTLRQILPAKVEHRRRQSGPWRIPAGEVQDAPRYEWRGAMLDVARHFFTVDEVERFIDVVSYYKLNRLHLHLTDDQGWRLMIESWPNLALHGGSLEVDGTPGGFFSQGDYSRLVEYAAARGVVIVPEIEMPGHVHAAVASYPELACESVAAPLYIGIAVGFSTLCFRTDLVYDFVADVLGEVAALTSGEYIHIGADETYVLLPEHYDEFVPKVEEILAAHGKRLIGWEEIGTTEIGEQAIVQYWDRPARLQLAVDRGNEIIMSPSRLAYLDSKYGPRTPIGRTWTSEFLTVEKAYSWDPAEMAPAGARIIGVEGTLFTETVREYGEVEYLAFPRLIGLAEIGWTGRGSSWNEYRQRLGQHGPRLDALEVNYYRAPEVPWR